MSNKEYSNRQLPAGSYLGYIIIVTNYDLFVEKKYVLTFAPKCGFRNCQEIHLA